MALAICEDRAAAELRAYARRAPSLRAAARAYALANALEGMTRAEAARLEGATPDEVQAKLGKTLQGADPPASEHAVAKLLTGAVFEQPTWFFSSLF